MNPIFESFPKIARLSREIVITEKIDGTNAQILITSDFGFATDMPVACLDGLAIYAGSRSRWLQTGKGEDNHGFAKWVQDNARDLLTLGGGRHYGEWWGGSIQRGYGLKEKRFSLFNTSRWLKESGELVPDCCCVVPVLYQGAFEDYVVDNALSHLAVVGSAAAPGFMEPEGIVIYHTAANICFKKTILDDAEGKHEEAHFKPRPEQAKPKKSPRRVANIPFEGPDRRKPV